MTNYKNNKVLNHYLINNLIIFAINFIHQGNYFIIQIHPGYHFHYHLMVDQLISNLPLLNYFNII